MAKKRLEDRILSREETLDKVQGMISEPCIKRIVTCDTVIDDATARKLGDLIVYAEGIREYIKPVMTKYIEAKLFILAEVFKKYMEPKLN